MKPFTTTPCGNCGHCSLACEMRLFRARVNAKKIARRNKERSRERSSAAESRSLVAVARDIVAVSGTPYADVVASLRKGQTYEDLVPRRVA